MKKTKPSTSTKKVLTIGIPCYNEELNIEPAFHEVGKILKKFSEYRYQFVFTDNGSTDQTRQVIAKLAKKHANVLGIGLSRNFGFEASIAALLDHAVGDALIVIPCDLQDPPELIVEFIRYWQQGYQIVTGRYLNSEDDPLTAWLRRSFYFVFKKISDLDIPVNASEVCLLDRQAVAAIRELPEKFRFFRGLRVWVGFKVAFVKYHRRARVRGKSAYNFISYFKYAERGLYGFSYLLLDLLMYGSMLMLGGVGFAIGLYLGYHWLTKLPLNTLSTILLFLLFAMSAQLFGLGILGKYIQVIVDEVKRRPVYVTQQLIGKIKPKAI